MDKTLYVTVTGINHYLGQKPFEPGRVIKLVKDKNNEYDSEAIAVKLPQIGKIGYIANSFHTVIQGTDVVWMQTNAMPHNKYSKIMEIVRMKKIPVKYFAYASAEKCAVKLEKYDNEKD